MGKREGGIRTRGEVPRPVRGALAGERQPRVQQGQSQK